MIFSFIFIQIFFVFNIPDFQEITSEDCHRNREIKQILYMMEKIFVLYGREHKKYFYADSRYVIDENSILYLLNRYDKAGSMMNYERFDVCNVLNEEDYTVCKNKLLKLAEEKTGDKNTEKEIENPDFSVFNKYTENFRRK